ncbi:MAG: PmoA family protein [Verrucomicrobiae bacterium]|nr:PmoA family protein [Verrucomicrobiae bacterium]MCP5540102.1 PmoA family protein [Akkermansiaceae bacterium]
MKLPAFLAVCLTIVPAAAPTPARGQDAKPRVFLQETEGGLRVELNGRLFTEYRYGDELLTFPVFYPILGPGELPMTRDYPFKEIPGEDKDHVHHRSLWFTHSSINGVNFWAVNKYKDHDPGRTVHKGFEKIESGENSGGFIAKNEYVAPDGKIVCTDTRTFRIHAVENDQATRILDYGVTIHASHGEVIFGNQKDGGMAIRVAPSLQVTARDKEPATPPTGHLVNSEGVRDLEAWGKRAKWVDIYGLVKEKPVGVAIFDHPSNPQHPTWWHARTYGLCTANIFGRGTFEKLEDPSSVDFRIEAGKSASFRWRFCFHQGDFEQAGVAGLYEKFAAE